MCMGSTCKFEEIIWKIIKLRENDWGVKPDGASALVWDTGCGLVHIFCLIFEPYLCIHKIILVRKLGRSNTIKESAKFIQKKDIC